MFELMGRYRPASANVVCEEFDGEMVVLNLGTGQYFALNRSATFLMNSLLQGHAIDALVLAINDSNISAGTMEFFTELVSQQLVEPDDSTSELTLTPDCLEAAWSLSERPSLEVHDDLADLIIADPIHDTEEAVGWPVRKTA